MYWLYWLSLVADLAAAASKKEVVVGPKVISTDATGNEVWILVDKSTTRTYEVRDYGALMPTLVYNCAYMPSICLNMKHRWGSVPDAGTAMFFHRDLDPKRTKARRDGVCPDNWLRTRTAEGRPCPETDQPQWSGYLQGPTRDDTRSKVGPVDAMLSRKLDKNGNPSTTLNRLATYEDVHSVDADNVPTVERVWTEYGAVMSCEEFPAASFIEGGPASGGYSAASTYCSPIGKSCTKAKLAHIMTDQDWQSRAHDHLKYFILYLASYGPDSASAAAQDTRRKKELLKYTIFKFKFYTVNDKDSKYSSWIEANGRKRYCFGPNLEGGGQNPGCSLGLDGNDPAPHNP